MAQVLRMDYMHNSPEAQISYIDSDMNKLENSDINLSPVAFPPPRPGETMH